ncbi:MAG: SpoIIE family protein phosphatase, partial [Victivallaceae bacterium]|nr:SpoIIE family protein phosphatase [Victivallaceae bacterium]
MTYCSFLSIDVAGSTIIKHGATPERIALTFSRYHSVVKKLSSENKGVTIAISGDGIMSQFYSPDQAVSCAFAIQGEMKEFNESIKVELLMAKKLQQYLYPDSIYKSDNIEIYSFYRPLFDVGGDLYDYIKLRDGRIIFFLADVSGHGIAGALFTVIVKMIFRNAIKYTINPAEIVHSMNRELFNSLPKESFVTLFCG